MPHASTQTMSFKYVQPIHAGMCVRVFAYLHICTHLWTRVDALKHIISKVIIGQMALERMNGLITVGKRKEWDLRKQT